MSEANKLTLIYLKFTLHWLVPKVDRLYILLTFAVFPSLLVPSKNSPSIIETWAVGEIKKRSLLF